MPETTSNSHPSKPLEILVVDDDSIICMLHRKRLESLFDHPVAVCRDGKKALEHIQEKDGKNFLVLLDINMPVMDGWEFLDECNSGESMEEITVAMVSSSVNIADKERSMEYPQVVDFIEKPLNHEKLLTLVEHEDIRKYFRKPLVWGRTEKLSC